MPTATTSCSIATLKGFVVVRTSGPSGLARFLRPVVRPVVRWAHRREISPNRMAVLSAMVMLIAVVWLTAGDLLGTIVATAAVFVVVLLGLTAREISEVPQPPPDFAPALARISEGMLWVGVVLGGVAAGFADMWLWATAVALCFGLRSVLGASRRASPSVRPHASDGAKGASSSVREFDPSRPEPDAASSHDPAFTTEIFGRSVQDTDQDTDQDQDTGTDQTETDQPSATAVSSHSRRWFRAATAPVVRFGARIVREERLAVVCVTLVLPDPRVTFVALLAVGALGLVAQLGSVTTPSTVRVMV